MRIKKVTQSSKSEIHDIWEVRLDKKVIERIRKIAGQRKTTMSWLARYCIFRFSHKKKINIPKFHNLIDDFKAERLPFQQMGRFYICFYGNDILSIKMQADNLNVTVSMLIRVSILRYLSSLEDEHRVPWWRLFWYGLKISKSIDIVRQRKQRSLVKEFLISIPYPVSDYWKKPEGPLPTFLLL